MPSLIENSADTQIPALDAVVSAEHATVPAPPIIPVAVKERVYRHKLPVRLGHWLNVVCLFILISSGLQIFNAHPALYWGDRSDRDKSLLSIRPMRTDSGEMKGVTTILGHQFDTTGVLGYSNGSGRAFPAWATVPSAKWLAMGRQWHLFFAWLFVINGVIFATYAFVSRHFKKDLLPTGQDLKQIPQAVKDHLVLRHPTGDEAKRYNVLQKLAYVGVICGLAPLIVLTGLTMSPTIDTAFPWLLTIFGGRQSARTIHFIACFSFVGFIVIHVSQVILTGFFNNIRSMITGYFVIKHEGASHGV
ncbi:MAG: Thiosulfate reductase cytochrome B subunit (membrane anchoring protein) [Nitrospira sp.]|jgi:thiosulfate reductase cytochrome b subunit|nr:MAG: Thiosulfate reductase cytochrome B subunit (membrane anchoring protein) [Nitrospira sp.]